MTTLNLFEKPAAYMLHDIGPRRFLPSIGCERDWPDIDLARSVREVMACYGLDQRDARLVEHEDVSVLHTDAGPVWIEDRSLQRHKRELDDKLGAVAFGVAQERMMRLLGGSPIGNCRGGR